MRQSHHTDLALMNGLSDSVTAFNDGRPLSVIQPTRDGRGIRLVHSEYVRDIVPPTDGFEHFGQFIINPGMAFTFKRLSAFAKWFSQYKFHQVAMHFRSLLPRASSQARGSVTLSQAGGMYDAPYTSKRAAEGNSNSVSSRVTDDLLCALDTNVNNSVNGGFRHIIYERQHDLHMTCLGMIECMADGCAPGLQAGELWVHYDVELTMPKYNTTENSANNEDIQLIWKRIAELESKVQQQIYEYNNLKFEVTSGNTWIDAVPRGKLSVEITFNQAQLDTRLAILEAALQAQIDALESAHQQLAAAIGGLAARMTNIETAHTSLVTLVNQQETQNQQDHAGFAASIALVNNDVIANKLLAEAANTQTNARVDATNLQINAIINLADARETANQLEHANLTAADAATNVRVDFVDSDLQQLKQLAYDREVANQLTHSELQSVDAQTSSRLDLAVTNLQQLTQTVDSYEIANQLAHTQFRDADAALSDRLNTHDIKILAMEALADVRDQNNEEAHMAIYSEIQRVNDMANMMIEDTNVRVNANQIQIDALNTRVDHTESNIMGINANLQQVTQTNDDRALTNEMEHSMMKATASQIENSVTATNTRVDTLSTDLQALIELAYNREAANQLTHTELQATDGELQNRIDQANTQVQSAHSRIDGLGAEILTLTDTVNTREAANLLQHSELQAQDVALGNSIAENKTATDALAAYVAELPTEVYTVGNGLVVIREIDGIKRKIRITIDETYVANNFDVSQLHQQALGTIVTTKQDIENKYDGEVFTLTEAQTSTNNRVQLLELQVAQLPTDVVADGFGLLFTPDISAGKHIIKAAIDTNYLARKDYVQQEITNINAAVANSEQVTMTRMNGMPNDVTANDNTVLISKYSDGAFTKVKVGCNLDVVASQNDIVTLANVQDGKRNTLAAKTVEDVLTGNTLMTRTFNTNAEGQKTVTLSVDSTKVALKTEIPTIPYPVGPQYYNEPGKTYAFNTILRQTTTEITMSPPMWCSTFYFINDMCVLNVAGRFTIRDAAWNVANEIVYELPFYQDASNVATTSIGASGNSQRGNSGQAYGAIAGYREIGMCSSNNYQNTRSYYLTSNYNATTNGVEVFKGQNYYNRMCTIVGLQLMYKPRWPLQPNPACFVPL